MTPSALSNETLEELLAAAGKATPGPWTGRWVRMSGDASVMGGDRLIASVHPKSMRSHDPEGDTERDANAALIAACDPQTITALITELLSHRSEGTVKPIVWRKTSYGNPEAETVVGIYRVNHAMNGGWSVTFGRDVLREASGRENFASIQEALDAAQLDYATRIKSALSPSTERAETIEECARVAAAYNEEYGDPADTLHHGRGIIAAIRALNPIDGGGQ